MAVTIYELRAEKSIHLSQNYDYGIIPFLFQIFISRFNKHGTGANLHRTIIPLFPSLNHPIFSFYVFTVLKRTHFLAENEIHAQRYMRAAGCPPG